MPIRSRPAAPSGGFTLPELVVVIVVLSVAVAGVMLAFSNAVRGSADPLAFKQANAIAESLLEEIQLTSYTAIANAAPAPALSRAEFNDVLDYAGYTTGASGMVDLAGTPVAALTAYNVSVTIAANVTLAAGLPAPAAGTFDVVNQAHLITVTVTGPGNIAIAESGYRINYP